MGQSQSGIKEMSKARIEMPPMYKVIMHNDDFTTMEFVVKVLKVVFFKEQQQAVRLMLEVHKHESAVVDIYTLDIAKSKCELAMKMAKDEGFPFVVTYEPEDDLPF